MHDVALYDSAFHDRALYDSTLHYVAHDSTLHDSALHDSALHDVAQHDSALQDNSALHDDSGLHDVALHDVALHDGALHRSVYVAMFSLRQAKNSEIPHLWPVQVEMAMGSVTLYKCPAHTTLLALDSVEPIIPLRLLVDHRFKINWQKD